MTLEPLLLQPPAQQPENWMLPATRLSAAMLDALPLPGNLVLSHPSFGSLTIHPDDGMPRPPMVEELVFTLAGECITLRCHRSIMAPMLRRSGHAVDKSAVQSDASLAALVLEHLLTTALEAVEAAEGTAIQFLTIRSVTPDDDAQGRIIRLRLASNLWPSVVAAELQARLPAGQVLLDRIFDRLCGPPPAPPVHLPAPITLLSPDFKLTLADVRSLAPGDALLLDRRWSPEAEARIGILGRVAAPATWRGGKLYLTGALRHPQAKDTLPMSLHDSEDQFDVAELPVTMTLELDRVELPFSTISGLKQGSILPFGTPMPETVRVLVNGRPFATAGLVQIDGQLGIRITALAGKPV
jgi:type III secretion system YscQ/HrcQ family protein